MVVLVATSAIHSYLLYPAKSDDEQPTIGGTTLPPNGRLFKSLTRIHDKTDTECHVDR
jgi:hypothetical protein